VYTVCRSARAKGWGHRTGGPVFANVIMSRKPSDGPLTRWAHAESIECSELSCDQLPSASAIFSLAWHYGCSFSLFWHATSAPKLRGYPLPTRTETLKAAGAALKTVADATPRDRMLIFQFEPSE
jgi:hypothetical protein